MAYSNIDQAVVLPSNQLPLGQVMQQGIAQAERQQARQDQLDERRYETDQRNALARQNRIEVNAASNLGSIADIKKEYKPLNSITADATAKAMKETLGILTKEENLKLSKPEFELLKERVVNEYFGDHAKRTLEVQDVKDVTSDIEKGLKSADPLLTREVMDNQYRNRWLNPDGTFKKQGEVMGQANYADFTNDPEKLSWIVKDTSALPSFFDRVKPSRVSGGELVSKSGKSHGVKWSGNITKYSNPVFADENGVPKVETSYQEIPLKNGKTMKVASDVLKQDMEADRDVKVAFDISHRNWEKQNKFDQLPQQERDILKEKYRLDYADAQLKRLHEVNKEEKDVTPKINISVGGNALNDAVENNSGILKEHLENAIQNNPQTVYTGTKNGNQTWGDLGQSDLTTPFKINVDFKTTNDLGETKTVNKSVPFDRYFVTPDNKIIGAYYKRDEKNNKTSKMEIQKEIPIKEFTKRLVSKTTSPKTRQAVVDANVNEVLGNKPNQASTKAIESYKVGNKIYNIPKNEVASFLKDMPNAQKQ